MCSQLSHSAINAILLVHVCLLIAWSTEILPKFTLFLTVNIHYLQCNAIQCSTKASCKEMNRLVTNINITTGSDRPSRNSQGILNTLLQPAMPTTPLPEMSVNPATLPSTPVNPTLTRSNSSHTVTDTSALWLVILAQVKQAEVLTPYTGQCDRFVDPTGKPLQPGTVIVCEDLSFIVYSNGKIYNFTGGNMGQLYITDPSKHKFTVKAANSPSTFSNILGSVLGLLPGFCRRHNQANNSKDVEDQNRLHRLCLKLQLLKPSTPYIVVKVQK